MNRSKSLFISTALVGMLTVNPLFAKTTDTTKTATTPTISATEISTLATIAAIDKNEILISTVANNKKADSGVIDLAKMMIDQHGSNLAQILDMVNSQHLKSLSSAEAEKISTQGKKGMLEIGGLQGKEFETAYVNAMVSGHQAALELIDKNLMKTAKSEEMKKFLTDTRAAVAMHLEHAKKLQDDMKA